MMIGEAQVMAMNPIFRSFFSGGAAVCAIVSRAESGKIDAMAARAVLASTAFKKPRRTLSFRNSAFINEASTKFVAPSPASRVASVAKDPCSAGE